MFPLVPPITGGNPNKLIVTAFWFDTTTTPVAEVSETFLIERDDAIPGWHGNSTGPSFTLAVTVTELPAKNHYDVGLELRRFDQHVDDESWHDIEIPPYPDFFTGRLEHVYNWPHDANGVTIRC